MRLRLTLRHDDGTRREVVVEADQGATLADLADRLTPAGATPPVLLVDGRQPPDRHPIGVPPLLDGAEISTTGVDSVAATRATWSPAPASPVGWQLRASSGADRGRVFAVRHGRSWLGRSGSAGVTIADTDVSRHHAVVTADPTGVTIADAGSTNGTYVDDTPVSATPVAVPLGGRVRIGATTLTLHRPPGSARPVHPDGQGHLLLGLGPVLTESRDPATDVPFPTEPTTAATRRLSMLTLILPVVVSAGIAAVLASPTMLLFGLTTPILLLGSWWSDRRGSGRERREAWQRFDDESQTARTRLRDTLAAEQAHRLAAYPDPAASLASAHARDERLWSWRPDDPDSLRLRVGVGRRPARTTAPGCPDGPPVLDPVPILVPLDDVRVVGLCGPRHRVLAAARWALGDLAVRRAPDRLAFAVLIADSSDLPAWHWLGRLPHARRRSDEAVPAIWIGPPTDATSDCRPPPGGTLVVVIDGAHRLAGHPDVVDIVALATAAPDSPATSAHPSVEGSVRVIAMDTTPDRLPASTGAVLELGAVPGDDALRGPSLDDAGPLLADEVPRSWADDLARCLAPLRVGPTTSAPTDLPRTVRLLDLVDPENDLPATVARAWQAPVASTRVVLGALAGGAFVVDLAQEGPHTLIGGTTGSGKSELLQTLIASLAMTNRPDAMAFVLVDYKGGAAFAGCERLPHTVGMVTDLDGHLTQRALASLSAELTRRERCLAAAGVTDLGDYQRRRDRHDPRQPALPRLVIVIDEFRMLAEELPDFVHGLVRIAAVGRSLGVHLIVATQRPGGIVSADIRANVSLRIALRVRDPIDSTDVVDTADAARIPESLPGRAVLVGAATKLTTFQTARVALPARQVDQPAVRVVDLPDLTAAGSRAASLPTPPAHQGPDGSPGRVRTDLDTIVDVTRDLAQRHGIPVLPSPWLAPLPDLVVVEPEPSDGESIVIGRGDDPAGQQQPPLGWDLSAETHLGLAGGPGSGRTTALRTIAAQLARRWGPSELHLYAVHDGALAGVAALPQCGAAVDLRDTGVVQRLVSRLRTQLEHRVVELARTGVASVAEARRAAFRGFEPPPWTVLLIDGWEPLVDALGTIDQGRGVDQLYGLVRDGASAGLRVAVTSDRAVLSGRLGGLVSRRVVLRPRDPLDLVLAGIPTSAIPSRQPPGRAIDVGSHDELQLAVLATDPAGHAQNLELAAEGRRQWERWCPGGVRPAASAARVTALPSRVRLVDVRDRLGSSAPDGSRPVLTVGVGGDEAGPVGVPVGPGTRRWFVCGPGGSGRTTSVLSLAAQLGLGRQVVVVRGRPGDQLPGLVDVPVLTGDDADDLVRRRQQDPRLAVLVDDADQLAGSPVDAVLREIARLADVDDGFLLVTAEQTRTTATRGVCAAAAADRTGVVLAPSEAADGAPFGLRLSGLDAPLPGRGILVVSGRQTIVQVAVTEESPLGR